MPPPAVCVLAILGTVGAALVFKQVCCLIRPPILSRPQRFISRVGLLSR